MKTKKLLSMLLALVMVLSFGALTVYAQEETMTYDLSKAALTKDFVVADGIDIGSFDTFTFSFTAGSSTTAAQTEHPVITDQTVTVGTQSNGHAYGSRTLDTVFTDADNFPHAGEYVYTVAEVGGTNDKITYDTSTYMIRLYIENDGDALKFSGVTVQKGEDKVDPSIPSGEDISGFNFTNSYKENIVKEDANGVLKITKIVTGAYGDKTKKFPITVTLTLPDTASESDVILADGSKGTLSGSTVTAELSDSDAIIFKQLPAGTTFTVSETQDINYKSKITGYVEIEDNAFVEGNRTAIAGNAPIVDTNGKVVSIENNRESIINTGIIINNLPYLLMVVIAGAGIAFMVLKKKRANA